MAKEIKYVLTDKQLEGLKKLYDESKDKLKTIENFDQFINLTIENAIDAHLQFVSMNEKMMDMFDSTMNSMSNNNIDLNNIDEFINNIFNNTSNHKKPNNEAKKKNEDKDENTSKTSKIKN